MSQTKRVFAAIILIILIGVPFLDWKLGAVLWMCAWLVFIFQNIYSGHNRQFGKNKDTENDQD
jgi:hypothetical protein